MTAPQPPIIGETVPRKSWWFGYVRAGHEFHVAAAIRRLGMKCRSTRRLDAKRVPTKRLPVPIRAPYLSNYLFIEATDEQWHLLRDVKWLAHTLTLIPRGLMERRLAIASHDGYVRHEIREMKDGKSHRLLTATPPEWVRKGELIQIGGVLAFLDALDADYLDRVRRHRMGQRVGHYQPGDSIRIMEGSLAGRLATFKHLVDASGFDRDVRLVAEVGSLGGKALDVVLDPLHVAKHAAE